MRGRKPRPIEERRLEGEDVSHRPLPEPVIAGGRVLEFPSPPRDLPKEARPFWKDTLKLLADVGILDQVDLPSLVLLAVQYARAAQARAIIAKEGITTYGSQAQIVEHPAVRIERAATRDFMKYAELFALNPIARTRLGLADLHRKSMAAELERQLSGDESSNGGHPPAIDVPEAEVVEDVGLPGA